MDTLTYLPTENFKKNKVDKLINERLRLMEIPQLKFDFSYVKVTALVNRFTEKTLETFVNIKNLPDSLIIKLFPQSVQTTFIVLIDRAWSSPPIFPSKASYTILCCLILDKPLNLLDLISNEK